LSQQYTNCSVSWRRNQGSVFIPTGATQLLLCHCTGRIFFQSALSVVWRGGSH